MTPIVPEVQSADDDEVVVALETARASEEGRDIEAAVQWVQRAASAARKQGRPDRAGVLSRAAAELAGSAERFERTPDETQTLGEMAEDDFSDSTIVDSAANIAAMTDSRPQPSPDTKAVLAPSVEQFPLSGPTPIAPRLQAKKAAASREIRVAVKRGPEGIFEARPIERGDELAEDEQEALLVPIAPESKF